MLMLLLMLLMLMLPLLPLLLSKPTKNKQQTSLESTFL